MPHIHSVAVFCGSRAGNDPAYRAAAQALGQGLAEAGIRLVYGGGRIGLMGIMADAALAAGGAVLGVIPEFLTRREVAHESITELVVTDSMHSRKQRMFEAADAFISLPGGLGTLDETIEIITWRQLRLHAKPILICDVAGSAAPFLATIEAAVEADFALPETQRLYEVLESVRDVLQRLSHLHRVASSEAARL
ncbi:MAG TPA: TIGR00730 family Rossman fold protein [Acetobacteraceae bacterium]|nr:TIGR00730 family Rossman fold protein [Acetobacteraceae bacterium]